MKVTLLNILSVLIALFAIILFGVVAATTDYIKFKAWIIFTLIVIILVIIIQLIFWIINRRKKISVEIEGEKKKIVSLEDIRKLQQKELFDQFAEYEKEKDFEDTWSMGYKNTPIYVRISLGEFSLKKYAFAFNLEDVNKRFSKGFSADTNDDKILATLEREANLISAEPKATPRTEEEIHELPTGERIVRTREHFEEKEPEVKKEGDLK